MTFKRCGACRFEWPTFEDFAMDPALELLGLQAAPSFPTANLFVFEHQQCGSTVSILARKIRHLFDIDMRKELPLLAGQEACSGLCARDVNTEQCPARCVNARDRVVMRRLEGLRSSRD